MAETTSERQQHRDSWVGTLATYLTHISHNEQVKNLLDNLRAIPHDKQAAVIGSDRKIRVISAARAALMAAAGQVNQTVIITASDRDAQEFADDVRSWWPGKPQEIAILPGWETLPHERLSPRADTVATRLSVFRRLAHPQTAEEEEEETGESDDQFGPIRVLIMPVRALLQPVAQGLGEIEPLLFVQGREMDMTQAVKQLAVNSYQRVDLVMERGQFAVRGDLLDVFAPTAPHPVRIEFFGDEIDSIKEFNASDQRTFGGTLPSLWATPCREIQLTEQVKSRAKALIGRIENADEMLENISNGIAVEGMESLLPVLVDNLETVPSLLPHGSLVVMNEPDRLRRASDDLTKTADEFLAASWHVAASGRGAGAPLDFGRASFLDLMDTMNKLRSSQHPVWELTEFSVDTEDESNVELDVEPAQQERGDEKAILSLLKDLLSTQTTTVITAAGHGTLTRLKQSVNDTDNLGANYSDITYVRSKAQHGFLWPAANLAIITEADILGRTSATSAYSGNKTARRRRHHIDLVDLKPGDYVVHEQHGIAKFVKLEKRTVGSGAMKADREYIVLEYAPSRRGAPADHLFVPTDQLDLITKYLGTEQPKLNKLGGSDWAETKAKAKKHVREIATDLVKLYSARSRVKGHAFSPDTPWQREMEDAFPYQETPDQLRTIDEIKQDMESPRPMDRLLSGDVGFGKTEIALRAAFKAVMDGYQVAVLVPTTLLVQQHFETFSERFAGFPVTIKPLSRFQSAATTRKTLEALSEGTVDVVIGTHKLLNSKIKFKKLGLVIIDEEQRFGVEHKETLKALQPNVDVLSMSATPIPRTLEMALTGIRQMSTLATPPEDRLPVLTYVGAYEDAQVVAAIRRELLRGGQVFYVHNRVRDIDQVAAKLHELIPEARIGIGHGKMGEKQLDTVIRDFWNREIDVLLCTTIIETGLDISNANTLIVDDAQRYGLSQLHQLRGRVGRSRERAYAYFLYDPEHSMTQEAHDRLATIAQNTALGSGYDVALRDLELRGTGNLLGAEQSGHIEGVGFDLYVRMVSQAVEQFKHPQEKEEEPVTVDLPIPASVPDSYISSEKLRLEAYRKLSAAKTQADLEDVREELEDRYGAIPQQVRLLFEVARLRQEAGKIGITEISALGSRVRFAKIDPAESVRMRMSRIYRGFLYRPVTHTVLIPAPFQRSEQAAESFDPQGVIEWVEQVLQDFQWKHEPGNPSVERP